MSDSECKSGDLLGVRPVGEALKVAADTAKEYLDAICLPAAQEYGLLLRDKVRAFRAENLVTIILKSRAKALESGIPASYHVDPRLATRILDEGSWARNERLQDLWAGLLTSSRCPNGDDETNLIFAQRLSQMTSLQAQLLEYACTQCDKYSTHGLIAAVALPTPIGQFLATFPYPLEQLDLELDHLRSLELISDGFAVGQLDPQLTPTALALNMYVRCQGSRRSPTEFFNVQCDNTVTWQPAVEISTPDAAGISA
jgi:hypothetical protein